MCKRAAIIQMAERMDSFYLFKSGTLRRKNSTLLLETGEEEIVLPVEQIRTLYIFGEIAVNKRALEFLSTHNISVMFFNYYGALVGSFSPHATNPVGSILQAQVLCLEKPERLRQIALSIQSAALHNSLSLLKYYHKKGIELDLQIRSVEIVIEEMNSANDVETIMLCEARAKKEYYSGFDLILNQTGFTFEKRSMQPPENEVNSLMSFGYYLLYGTVLAELNRSRLYPELPFIHSKQRTGYGLQYDLADIYKPIFIDRMFLGIIRRRSIQKEDFERRENGGVYLKESGKKKLVEQYDLELKNKIHYDGKNRSYRSIIQHDIHRLIDHLLDPDYPLDFYRHVW